MFRFRQFSVDDSSCAMKVGTDGVLLGSLCPIINSVSTGKKEYYDASPAYNYNVLDLGCGSGVVALMIAQRSDCANVWGIEIDSDAAVQAKENVSRCFWKDRIEIVCGDARTFPFNKTFDLIVCNPPFYKVNGGQSSGKASRDKARRSDTLTFLDVITLAARLLNDGGRLCVIIPNASSEDFIYSSWLHSLQLEHHILIRTKATKPFSRSILTFVNQSATLTPRKRELILLDDNSLPTAAYRTIVAPFYLRA